MVDAAEAAEYMNGDEHNLERKILAKLVEYVDELPF
jgi:hypothetical protein